MNKTLKALRRSRKYTLKELAARIGCSAKTLALYETNPPAVVNRKISDGLAKALDVTPGYILKLLGSTAAASSAGQDRSRPVRAAKAAASGRKRTRRPAPAFTPSQCALLATLMQNEIRRLREFILAAERGPSEGGPLQTAVQDTQAEIQALQTLMRLILPE